MQDFVLYSKYFNNKSRANHSMQKSNPITVLSFASVSSFKTCKSQHFHSIKRKSFTLLPIIQITVMLVSGDRAYMYICRMQWNFRVVWRNTTCKSIKHFMWTWENCVVYFPYCYLFIDFVKMNFDITFPQKCDIRNVSPVNLSVLCDWEEKPRATHFIVMAQKYNK